MIAQFNASRVEGKCHWPEITKTRRSPMEKHTHLHGCTLIDAISVGVLSSFPQRPGSPKGLPKSTIQPPKLETRKIPST